MNPEKVRIYVIRLRPVVALWAGDWSKRTGDWSKRMHFSCA